FFEHYLYQAQLPKLVERRVGDSLRLRWETKAESKFEMPLDVLVNGEIQQVVVSNDDDTVIAGLAADAHIIIDPKHKVLRDIDYISKRAEFDRARFEAEAKDTSHEE